MKKTTFNEIMKEFDFREYKSDYAHPLFISEKYRVEIERVRSGFTGKVGWNLKIKGWYEMMGVSKATITEKLREYFDLD